jgi:GT2 family glycosyltransferase
VSRPSAGVVVLVREDHVGIRSCLEALRPSLGPGDQTIVVTTGPSTSVRRELNRHPWIQVVDADGFDIPAARNRAAALIDRDVVVFLDDDTVPGKRWLDALLAAFTDPTVAAAGPVSNWAPPAQTVVDLPDAADKAAFRAFAYERFQTAGSATRPVDVLSGSFLAVRRADFAAAGGFDDGYALGAYADEDLCLRLRAAGGRLLVADGAVVFHTGRATIDAVGADWQAALVEGAARFERQHGEDVSPPLLTACLIVKDEERFLPDCLESIRDVVDEIVIHDTGSTDGTVALARAAGAVVVEGGWNDDFAAARNIALAHCRGEWILWIDADERLEGDRDALRAALRHGEATAPGLVVRIDNVAEDGRVTTRHKALRIFRRHRARWSGRLHEQVVARLGGSGLPRADFEGVSLRHLGYTGELVKGRDKAQRNIRLAEAGLSDGTGDRGVALLNLARSLVLDGRLDEAVARCREGLTVPATPALRSGLLRVGAEAMMAMGRPEEALEWIAKLRATTTRPEIADFLEGSVLLLQGKGEEAHRLLAPLDDVWDDLGLSAPDAAVRLRSAAAALIAGKSDDAADNLLAVVRERPHSPVWGHLAEAAWRSDRPVATVAETVPDSHLRSVLAQLVLAHPEAADALGEALWARFPGDPRLVAFGTRHGERMGTARALEWAARVRQVGLADQCPLLRRAARPDVAPIERIRAAVVAHGAFGDASAEEAVALAAGVVAPTDFVTALYELSELGPALLPSFVTGAVTEPERCSAMADALEAVGAPDEAAAVRRHGLVLAGQA